MGAIARLECAARCLSRESRHGTTATPIGGAELSRSLRFVTVREDLHSVSDAHVCASAGGLEMRGTQARSSARDRRFDPGCDVCTARAVAGRSGDGLRDRNRVKGARRSRGSSVRRGRRLHASDERRAVTQRVLASRFQREVRPRLGSAQSPNSSSGGIARPVPRSCPTGPRTNGEASIFAAERILWRWSTERPEDLAGTAFAAADDRGKECARLWAPRNRYADLRTSFAVDENGNCPSGGVPGFTSRRSRTLSRTGWMVSPNCDQIGSRPLSCENSPSSRCST